jgi:dTDP-4-amino-4,6-dideoxygalactose transaminase
MSNDKLPAPATTAGAAFELTWPRPAELEPAFLARATNGPTWSGYAGTDLPLRSALERLLAAVHGHNYAVTLNSGTDAICAGVLTALTMKGKVDEGTVQRDKALAWCAGRTQVLVPRLTFVPGTYGGVHAAVTLALKAEPEFVAFDCRGPADPTVDVRALVAYLHAHADQILCVVVPSLLGTWARLDPIIEAARAHGIPVGHDAAQAVGARRPGRLKPDFRTGSGHGGKGGNNGGEEGDVEVDDPLAAWIARRYGDAGNLPAGNLNALGYAPDVELLAPAMSRRLAAHPAAVSAAQFWYTMEARPTIAMVRREIREVLEPYGVFDLPALEAAAQHDPYSEPMYGDLLVVRDESPLSPDEWTERMRRAGFGAQGTPYERYCVRRMYPFASEHEDWADKVTLAGPTQNADRIRERGVIIHVGALMDARTPARLADVVSAALGR